jgi:hypothetical protein
MTQKQTFLKNLVDSTMSISLEHVVYNEKVVNFGFDEKTITGDITKFRYKLSGNETKYFFDVNLYKLKKPSFWQKHFGFRPLLRYLAHSNPFGIGSDKSEYYLRVETRQSTQYSYNWISTDNFTSKESELLKKVFDFLTKRIEEKRFAKEEQDYRKINVELIKLVDKSLTRDEKLEDLLKK